VDEAVDTPRARGAEDLDLAARRVALLEDPVTDGIVDVVVDVGDAVGPDDLPSCVPGSCGTV
jgi:hypothetical protein